jgi:diguanylate cyclase (GGDEF)-like protein
MATMPFPSPFSWPWPSSWPAFGNFYGQVRFWREQALTCPLTGLPNRRALEMALEREAARVERGEKPFAFILLDLDDFKRVNDEKGHQEGDRLLQRVAQYLKTHVRQGDLVGRWGGEEFAILLPATDPLGAERLAERLREGIAALGVTASFGVALYQGICRDSSSGRTRPSTRPRPWGRTG